MPRLLWLMFQVPMSSPQMTRMFGLLAWAEASSGVAASTDRNRNLNAFIEFLRIFTGPAAGAEAGGKICMVDAAGECTAPRQCGAQFWVIVAPIMGRGAKREKPAIRLLHGSGGARLYQEALRLLEYE